VVIDVAGHKRAIRLSWKQPLITLETDKATMDVPSTAAGKSRRCAVSKGSRISKGTPLVRIESGSEACSEQAGTHLVRRRRQQPIPAILKIPGRLAAPQLLVLGSGPGGYTAAFRGADLV